MSIAVSADIKPSRLLLLVTAFASLCVALIGVLLVVWPAGCAVLDCPILAGHELSGGGAGHGAGVARAQGDLAAYFRHRADSRVEHLLPSARAKPQVMKAGLAQLLAAAPSGRACCFCACAWKMARPDHSHSPDSVSEDTFRALSVACRWLISHNTAKARMLEKWQT
jgi:hypothetical protein